MKKIFLLAFLVFLGKVSFSQNVISLFNKANNFFYYMEEAKYDSAHMYFDETEQAKISAEDLKKIWTAIKSKFGNVKSLEAIQSKVQGQFFSVVVEGKFENDDQNFILGFNKSEKLVGLYTLPKPVTYTLPSYADTAMYQEKSVYLNTKGHQLAAVVTTPKNTNNFPIVVLVHGSGPSDMDETIGVTKPFKDIALGLAAKGIASVRYVKRTLLYPGDFTKTFTVKEEVTDDALAAIATAKTVKGADLKNIYLFGHSLGGMLAPQMATLAPELNGIILAAAPARKLTDIIIEQNKYFFDLAKDTTAKGKKEFDAVLADVARSRVSELGAMKPDSVIIGLPVSYWISLNSYDQVAVAKKLNKRIFVIQGGNDFQVSQKDYALWDAALNKKKNASLKFYPELNHLLTPQTEKGTAAQYQIPANVSEKMIDDLALWIKGQPIMK
ncbi:alpha/beta fold hydrolase [Pedobacter sp. Du54]|uniref:alpha/beta hydrolase n=1 Tax=Pedobacter anseongensis TaxID=3133439 RepID=UPI0030B3410A